MTSRKLGIIFLAAVILSFLTGYHASRLLPFLPTGGGGDMFEYITDSFERYYYYEIDDDAINAAFIAHMEATVRAYAEANNDPYTRLVATPLSSVPGDDERFVGIGISFFIEGAYLRVLDVYQGSAADGRLYPNDLITGLVIDGVDLDFATLPDQTAILETLKGELDDAKILIVYDPDGIRHDIDIIYSEILTPTAFAVDLMEDDIAYLRITRFTEWIEDITPGTSKVFADRLLELETTMLLDNSEDKTLILDLRDNPGGALSALHNQGQSGILPGIVQRLLVRDIENSVFQMIPRSGKPVVFNGGLNQPKPYHIVVLVNERSASAAEVLAAGLHVNGGYALYGTPTFGKDVYQNTIRLRDIRGIRYSLVYTEGRWFYNDGMSVEETPLPVNLIEQGGLFTIDMPVYMGLTVHDEVRQGLGLYQHFFNVYYNLDGEDMIRTDHYFDDETLAVITRFQLEEGLPLTGHLDRTTAIRVHQIYMATIHDWQEDRQLLTLIDLIKNS